MGETLLTVFPNELIAGFWVGVLEHEGIRSFVKPQMGGYGMWGHDSFIPHGLYVPSEQLEEARAILANDPEIEEPRS
jgi:hypothetical protein